MKPFNLQEALAGKPVVTRNGTAVLDVAYLPNAREYKVAATLNETFTDKGQLWGGEKTSIYDLFMKDTIEKRIGYINVWQNTDKFSPPYASFHYSLEQSAAERVQSCSGKEKALLARLQFDYTYNTETQEITINA